MISFVEHKKEKMIQKIKYHHGYGNLLEKPNELDKAFLLKGKQIPQEINELFIKLKISELSGTYSSDLAADPSELDYLLIETESETIEIKVKDRGLNLLMGNNDKLKIIHQFIEKTLGYLSEM